MAQLQRRIEMLRAAAASGGVREALKSSWQALKTEIDAVKRRTAGEPSLAVVEMPSEEVSTQRRRASDASRAVVVAAEGSTVAASDGSSVPNNGHSIDDAVRRSSEPLTSPSDNKVHLPSLPETLPESGSRREGKYVFEGISAVPRSPELEDPDDNDNDRGGGNPGSGSAGDCSADASVDGPRESMFKAVQVLSANPVYGMTPSDSTFSPMSGSPAGPHSRGWSGHVPPAGGGGGSYVAAGSGLGHVESSMKTRDDILTVVSNLLTVDSEGTYPEGNI